MKYTVYAREVHIQAYIFEADSPEQAVEFFNNGEPEGELGSIEYSHVDGFTHVEDEEGQSFFEGEENES